MNLPDIATAGVSVIIPSYESHATARATLESLRKQTFRDFEVILVDSSRGDAVEHIAADFPEIRYHHAMQRLLPHEARNVGVKLARHDLLLFTDPDIVAAADWIEKLLGTYRDASTPLAGAVASVQRDWLGLGIHFAKFDLWLPGGGPRTVPVAASVNFLCARDLLDQAGGFDGNEMIGDTLLSWQLLRRGHDLRFASDAIVHHDHRSTFAQLLRERFVRGADFARLRSERESWNPPRTFAILVATVFPLRLIKLIARTFSACVRAGCAFDFVRTLPVIAAGHAAWLAGEVTQYWRRLFFLRVSSEASGRAHNNAGA
jgi:glycosyltransferase involved in cell wall biosynthesis